MKSKPARLRPALTTIAALLIAAASAPADIVHLKDGRAYEGEIIRQDSHDLRIDTMVTATIRTQLTFKADEIERVELRPVPKGFFDPPPPEPRVSEPEDFEPEVVLYIEVPIVGAFGTDVFAAGIEDVLRYARRHRIEHVVFMIDSDGHGIDEAGRAYDALKKYDRALEYHAIIKRCTGDALAIPIWCDTIRLLPGALVGGSAASMASEDASDAQEAMVRTQIANEISRDMGQRGRDPLLIRAMIDPTESLAGWLAADGEMIIAPLAPVDLAPDQLIFRVEGNEVLVLDETQAVALGLPRFDGSAEALGADLGFESWAPESRYGYDAMGEQAATERQRGNAATVQHAKAVERNIARREYIERYIEQALKGAAEWAPQKGEYATYSRRWRWGWGGARYGSGGNWTWESQRRWRDRTDTMARYLRTAGAGIAEAAKLDQEAIELGLEPTFKPGELQFMADDVRTKYDELGANRGDRRY